VELAASLFGAMPKHFIRLHLAPIGRLWRLHTGQAEHAARPLAATEVDGTSVASLVCRQAGIVPAYMRLSRGLLAEEGTFPKRRTTMSMWKWALAPLALSVALSGCGKTTAGRDAATERTSPQTVTAKKPMTPESSSEMKSGPATSAKPAARTAAPATEPKAPEKPAAKTGGESAKPMPAAPPTTTKANEQPAKSAPEPSSPAVKPGAKK
jgi:hypothetical protein